MVQGLKPDTRPVMDKKYFAEFKQACPEAPTRYMPYHIALLQANVHIPTGSPPAYPSELRLVKAKRHKQAGDENIKEATWVASHLCHNQQCVDVNHLRWEPSWFNRLRDNCPGGRECIHRPDACINPHRPSDEGLIDWTAYIDE